MGGLTSEAAQCESVFKAAYLVPGKHLTISRCLPMMMPVVQYFILVGVVWGGVAVILSCQAVPDILYNSLAITFIVGVDELLFEFIAKCFGMSGEFEIDFSQTGGSDSARSG